MADHRRFSSASPSSASNIVSTSKHIISSAKLVLLGEAAVGKSSLVMRFVSNVFQENKEPTIGAAFLTQKCALPSRTVKFEIWDTAGQERFASLAPMYYRNAQAALVVYDITKPSSLTKARHWVAELQKQAKPGIVIALVGNKADLAQQARVHRRSVADPDSTASAEDDTVDADRDGRLSQRSSPVESADDSTPPGEHKSLSSQRNTSSSPSRSLQSSPTPEGLSSTDATPAPSRPSSSQKSSKPSSTQSHPPSSRSPPSAKQSSSSPSSQSSQNRSPEYLSTEAGRAFAKEEGLLFFETSAKSGLNVVELFTAIANNIPEASLKRPRLPSGNALGVGGISSSGEETTPGGGVILNGTRNRRLDGFDDNRPNACAC